MITAERRGVIAGGEQASKLPASRGRMQDEEIERLARFIWLVMYRAGFAHIEPRDEFIAGFLTGFKTNVVQPI